MRRFNPYALQRRLKDNEDFKGGRVEGRFRIEYFLDLEEIVAEMKAPVARMQNELNDAKVRLSELTETESVVVLYENPERFRTLANQWTGAASCRFFCFMSSR